MRIKILKLEHTNFSGGCCDLHRIFGEILQDKFDLMHLLANALCTLANNLVKQIESLATEVVGSREEMRNMSSAQNNLGKRVSGFEKCKLADTSRVLDAGVARNCEPIELVFPDFPVIPVDLLPNLIVVIGERVGVNFTKDYVKAVNRRKLRAVKVQDGTSAPPLLHPTIRRVQ